MEQKYYAARHDHAEEQREDQDQSPKIADALLERPSSHQAMDPSTDDENNAHRQCTPDAGLQDLDWAQTLPSPADPRPMNGDPNQDAAVYGEYRASEQEKINIGTRAKSRDRNRNCVD